MVVTITHDHEARRRSYELIAEAFAARRRAGGGRGAAGSSRSCGTASRPSRGRRTRAPAARTRPARPTPPSSNRRLVAVKVSSASPIEAYSTSRWRSRSDSSSKRYWRNSRYAEKRDRREEGDREHREHHVERRPAAGQHREHERDERHHAELPASCTPEGRRHDASLDRAGSSRAPAPARPAPPGTRRTRAWSGAPGSAAGRRSTRSRRRRPAGWPPRGRSEVRSPSSPHTIVPSSSSPLSTTAGIESRNEKRAAASRSKPRNSPAVIVAPEREDARNQRQRPGRSR